MQAALEVVGNIQSGNIPLEAGTIAELVSQQAGSGQYSTDMSMTALFAFWIIGILDSFRVGRRLEKLD